jgi:hypothetical protein
MKRNRLLSLFYEFKKRMFANSSPRYAEFIMIVSMPNQLKAACEHLRYWPYVKAFYPLSDKYMKVIIYVGTHIQKKFWEHYVLQSIKLMNKCVSQYDCTFILKNSRKNFSMMYRADAFLRPDSMLKSFAYFIDGVERITI